MLEAVRLLTAGYCVHPEAMTRAGASWRPCRFPAGFALLHHKRHGPILFDTGYAGHFADATRGFPNRLYALTTPVQLHADETAAEQLRCSGIEPGDVRHVIVSHFHADHIAGLKDFPRATIVCSETAWRSVAHLRGLSALRRAYLPSLMPADAAERLRFAERSPRMPLPPSLAPFREGWDLFEDESVIAVSLPGHARGQLGLYVPEPVPRLLIADAAWSLAAVRDNRPPPGITTAFLGDTAQYRATLSGLHELSLRNPALAIVPAHALPEMEQAS